MEGRKERKRERRGENKEENKESLSIRNNTDGENKVIIQKWQN